MIKNGISEPQKKQANFRFYEELNDFLPRSKRKKDQVYRFWGRPSVKDAIEALGIPHPEVEIIIVDNRSVGFNYRLKNNDRVAVYPVFESLDISPLLRLRPEPLRKIKFSVDGNLEKLARRLRLLGFDSCGASGITKDELIKKALSEKRIILTTDKNILKQKVVTHGYYIREKTIEKQVKEILRRFDLGDQVKPFTRCMVCNGILDEINKQIIKSMLPENVHKHCERFKQCTKCKKIYWEGTHYIKMQHQIDKLLCEYRD